VLKKISAVTIGVLAVAAIAIASIPTAREEIHWLWAAHKDKTSSYESYVRTWPNGRHYNDAQTRYDEHGWSDAQAVNTTKGFERYIQFHGDGKHTEEARDKIESLNWQEAETTNNIKGFERYIQFHGEGKHVSEAKNKIKALRNDQAIYTAAFREGTKSSLKKFLDDFPGHVKQDAAQQALKEITEGRDIVDLIKEKKIEIKTQGSGIQSVRVGVRRLVPYPLTVRIPVGSYFISANASSQNMVTTEESRIRLESSEWEYVSPDAACANRPRDIPSSDDSFTVQRSPHQKELAKLMPILEKEGASYAVRQAAVWIVTDDADYYDLGTLVSQSQFEAFGGSRVINENEAARAMIILDKAGININQKSIWQDREIIMSGLEDDDLKKWLREKK
jgi:outer membrane protein assembly factor BamD (BamD/ComL family)